MSKRLERTHGLVALILSPTRELAMQTFEVLQNLLKIYIKCVPGIVMGGENRVHEKARLRKGWETSLPALTTVLTITCQGINVLVATPGRLTDHLRNTEIVDLSNGTVDLSWFA